MCLLHEIKCNYICFQMKKGLDGDDDDIGFQDAKSNDTTCRYKPPDLQYMGRKLKIRFRIKDTGKIQ